MIHPSRSLRALAAAAALWWGAGVASAALEVPRSNVGFHSALFDALLVVMQKPGRFLARTDGDSMLPFFGHGSLAVVQRIEPDRLRLGMIAVYRNAEGEAVAHRVVASTAGGWRVQGFNNDRPDSTIVGASNLQGVLYATFYTSGYNETADAGSAVLATLPVVLGAPAK